MFSISERDAGLPKTEFASPLEIAVKALPNAACLESPLIFKNCHPDCPALSISFGSIPD